MLGGLYLLFARLAAGSWRELAAMFSAVATLFALAFVGDHIMRRTGRRLQQRPDLLWAIPMSALLGAAAGSAYTLISSEHYNLPPAVTGAATMVMLAIAGRLWDMSRRRAP